MSKIRASYMEGNVKLAQYKCGWWVIVKGREGVRLGLVNMRHKDGSYTVQFGADGEQVKTMEGIGT